VRRRRLGSTGYEVSEVGLGAWAIGADWGPVAEDDAVATIQAAIDHGVDFIDTADVYGDGRSERLVGSVRRGRPDARLVIATKAGRRLSPHRADGYTADNLRRFVDRSLTNLQMDSLDVLQLHCPPTDVYDRPEVFAALDDLVDEGKIRHYGVSVEKVEEALAAIEYPGVETVQIIYNMFRQRPAERFLPLAAEHDIGVIARVPLASGLLTGKLTSDTEFAPDDHRRFNRHGEAFDVGETFAGVPYDVGLAAVEQLRPLVPEGWTMAQLALRWILDDPSVSTVIPGAKNPDQAAANASASTLEPLDAGMRRRIAAIYRDLIAPHVHQRW